MRLTKKNVYREISEWVIILFQSLEGEGKFRGRIIYQMKMDQLFVEVGLFLVFSLERVFFKDYYIEDFVV